jgi:hypothetical protein
VIVVRRAVSAHTHDGVLRRGVALRRMRQHVAERERRELGRRALVPANCNALGQIHGVGADGDGVQ